FVVGRLGGMMAEHMPGSAREELEKGFGTKRGAGQQRSDRVEPLHPPAAQFTVTIRGAAQGADDFMACPVESENEIAPGKGACAGEEYAHVRKALAGSVAAARLGPF